MYAMIIVETRKYNHVQRIQNTPAIKLLSFFGARYSIVTGEL